MRVMVFIRDSFPIVPFLFFPSKPCSCRGASAVPVNFKDKFCDRSAMRWWRPRPPMRTPPGTAMAQVIDVPPAIRPRRISGYWPDGTMRTPIASETTDFSPGIQFFAMPVVGRVGDEKSRDAGALDKLVI